MGEILSTADRAYFVLQMRRQLNSAVHRRMNVLLLLDDGLSVPHIAQVLYIDAGTVRGHLDLYRTQGRTGIEALLYDGSSPDLEPEQEAVLTAELDARVYPTAKQIAAFIFNTFGVSYTPNALAKYLVRIGFCYKKPKCVPAKADEAAQQAFLEDTLLPLMQAAGPEKPLYFVDATHPSHTGHAAFGWMRKGATKELQSNHGRSNLNINGALSWPDRALVHREEERITSEAQIALFNDLLTRHPQAEAISVVMDNAKYNHSKALGAWFADAGKRIKPVYLPSYAPNLNLIERFWLFLKKKALWNRYYPKFAEFAQAIRNVLQTLGSFDRELKTILTEKFHIIGEPENRILAA